MTEEDKSIAQAWLLERLRPGNWLDVQPNEQIPPQIINWDRTIINMHQVCFSPEVRRRKQAGTLGDDFVLLAAQLIQPHEGTQQVRFNDEVRGVPYVRTGRPVHKDEEALLSDFANLECFDLLEDELDCGHFTIFWTGKGWVGSFDFRSGRAKCLSLIDKSLSFLAVTRIAIEKGHAEPAIDNLHTACELIAKTRLILNHHPAHNWKSHGKVHSEINKMGRLGNVDASFLETFNRLGRVRGHAKYATGYDAELPSWDEVDLVETMARGLQETVRPRKPDLET